MKKDEKIKLILSVIALCGILIFSYIKNQDNHSINPNLVDFESPTGPVKISSFKGKINLLYFGFLSCPEACPTTLSHTAAAFKLLTPDEQKKVQLLFIDLDPEKDTLEKMKAYTDFFHPNIIPLRLPLKELNEVTRFFGIAFMKVPLKSSMGYTIDHSTDILVLSPTGEMLPNIHHGTSAANMVLVIKKIIKDYSKDIK
jgi:protein SCO1/2